MSANKTYHSNNIQRIHHNFIYTEFGTIKIASENNKVIMKAQIEKRENDD